MKEDESSYFFCHKKNKKKVDCKKQLELFKQLKEGNINARSDLIENNLGLVIHEVNKKFSTLPMDRDDIISIGVIGLIKGIDHYDYSLGIKFSSFAVRCIDNEILMSFRNNKRHLHNTSLNNPLRIDEEGNEVTINDILVDEKINFVEDYEKSEEYKLVNDIINELPEKFKKIILMHYGFLNDKMYSQQEIADMLQVSQSAVSRQIKRILSKIECEYSKSNSENPKKYLKTK